MPIKVVDALHTGVIVRSLARAIHLFESVLGLKIQRRNHLQPPISAIVGCDHVGIHIAIVELLGGHLLELLEYESPHPSASDAASKAMAPHKPLAWELGSWHLCLTVENLGDTVAELKAATWDGEGMGWNLCNAPQRLQSGPNAGRKLCYLKDDEGMILELFQARDGSDGVK